jgi:ATP-dependent DNA ligase
MQIKDFTYFYPERAQLLLRDSKSFIQLSDDSEWIAEPKYNGSRCCLHILNGKPMFYSRHGDTLKYNENPHSDMIDFLKKYFKTGYYIFDGELRHNKVVGVRDKLVIFDCFIYENVVLNRMPFRERRSLLSIFPENDSRPISAIQSYSTDFDNAFDFVTKDEEMEGLVLKNLNGKLVLGRTSSANSNWQFKVRIQTGRHRY